MHVQLNPVATQFAPAHLNKSAGHLYDPTHLPDYVSAKTQAPPKEPIIVAVSAGPRTSAPLQSATPTDDDSDDVEMIEDSTPEVSPVKQNGSPTKATPVESAIAETIKIELFVPKVVESEVAAKEPEVMDVSVEQPAEEEPVADKEVVETEDAVLVVESEPVASLPIAPSEETSEKPSELDDESKASAVKTECLEPVIQDEILVKPTEEVSSAPVAAAEDAQPQPSPVVEEPPAPATKSRKRNRSVSPVRVADDDSVTLPPSKRLCAELERTFNDHDKTLREYIDKTANTSLDEVDRHLEQLKNDIAHLDELSVAKELEWNNILHLKKCKEEIVLRLNRRKTVMEIMAGKMGEMPVGGEDKSLPVLDKRMVRELQKATVASHDGHNNHEALGQQTSQAILSSRANMRSVDLAREKANAARFQRNILPKPAAPPASASPGLVLLSQPHSTSSSPILNSYITSGATPANNNVDLSATNTNHLSATQQLQLQQFQQQQLHNQAINELLMNGAGNQHTTSAGVQIGRQGHIKDVRSIIDDHRQKHPEQVPRRGRRRRGSPSPPSNESSLAAPAAHNMSNITASLAPGNVSMNDFLLELAKVTNERIKNHNSQSNAHSPRRHSIDLKNTSTPIMKAALGYPEVTLHPVSMAMQDSNSQNSATGGTSASPTAHSNSLLHGILTKNTRPQPGAAAVSGFTSFSPTLARLLTAPERIAPLLPGPLAGQNLSNINNNNNSYHGKLAHGLPAGQMSGGGIVNLTNKPQSEITITPVVNSMSHSLQHSLIQNQLEQHQQQQQRLQNRLDAANFRSKQDLVLLDDEADDSVDRLVIDEGNDDQHHHQSLGGGPAAQDFQENDVPECQGCKKREAQFVCAGCSNQWYCSRSCQVSAWDEHSDVCTG